MERDACQKPKSTALFGVDVLGHGFSRSTCFSREIVSTGAIYRLRRRILPWKVHLTRAKMKFAFFRIFNFFVAIPHVWCMWSWNARIKFTRKRDWLQWFFRPLSRWSEQLSPLIARTSARADFPIVFAPLRLVVIAINHAAAQNKSSRAEGGGGI